MYSRKTYEESGSYTITPPPGYDGSRFRRRSDGRDDSFPPYDVPTKKIETPKKEEEDSGQKKKKTIGAEELLIVALIIALAGEESPCIELILMLALLLCT